jgi:hypothetical protein
MLPIANNRKQQAKIRPIWSPWLFTLSVRVAGFFIVNGTKNLKKIY